MINEIRVAFAHRFKDVIAANCLSLPKLEVALFDVCFNIDSLKVMELSFLCLGEKTYLIGTVDDKEMEKIEREVEWRREEKNLAWRQSFMIHGGNKAPQNELRKGPKCWRKDTRVVIYCLFEKMVKMWLENENGLQAAGKK